MKKEVKMVTIEEIDIVWGSSNFGTMSKEDVVKFGLLKCASGYHQGQTSRYILKELGLITEGYNLTRRGRYCLYAFFENNNTL
jgi:hypothetical protein